MGHSGVGWGSLKNLNSHHFLEGFWASKRNESFWIWKIIPRQVTSKKIWKPKPNHTLNTYWWGADMGGFAGSCGTGCISQDTYLIYYVI